MRKKLITIILIPFFLIFSVGLQCSEFLSIQSYIATDVNKLLTQAATWSYTTVISDDTTGWNDDGSYLPDIAIDGDGNVHVVWYDSTDGEWGADTEIMYAKYTDSGWSNATVISDDATGWNNGSSWNPSIAVDGEGNVHVVWEDGTDGEWGTDDEIMYARNTGTGWSNATVISDDATGWNDGNSNIPDISIDSNGNAHVVWDDDTIGEWGTDEEIMYARHIIVGWSNATVISDDATGWNDGSSNYPSIATDGDGNVHVVWEDGTTGEWGTDIEIMYAKQSGASWSNATVISDDATGWNNDYSGYPSIVIDNNDNIHGVWSDSTDGVWGTDSEIMYTKYTGTGWSYPTVISDDATGWNVGASYSADIATDSDGNLHVVWYDQTAGEWGSDYEIMYSKHSGANWSNATVVSDDATGWNDDHSYHPSIATDGDGNVHVVWREETDGVWGTDTEIIYSKKLVPSSPQTPSEEAPIYLILPQGGDISSFLLSPLGIGIIAGVGAMFIILLIVIINTKKNVAELNKKISKTSKI